MPLKYAPGQRKIRYSRGGFLIQEPWKFCSGIRVVRGWRIRATKLNRSSCIFRSSFQDFRDSFFPRALLCHMENYSIGDQFTVFDKISGWVYFNLKIEVFIKDSDLFRFFRNFSLCQESNHGSASEMTNEYAKEVLTSNDVNNWLSYFERVVILQSFYTGQQTWKKERRGEAHTFSFIHGDKSWNTNSRFRAYQREKENQPLPLKKKNINFKTFHR